MPGMGSIADGHHHAGPSSKVKSLAQHYFQGKALHSFVRPIMGKQLEAMRAWLPSLAASDTPALKALGQELGALIQQADAALKARTDADAALSRFRQIGEHYQFINKVNAALKSVYGTLAAMPHDHVGLPRILPMPSF